MTTPATAAQDEEAVATVHIAAPIESRRMYLKHSETQDSLIETLRQIMTFRVVGSLLPKRSKGYRSAESYADRHFPISEHEYPWRAEYRLKIDGDQGEVLDAIQKVLDNGCVLDGGDCNIFAKVQIEIDKTIENEQGHVWAALQLPLNVQTGVRVPVDGESYTVEKVIDHDAILGELIAQVECHHAINVERA